VGWRKDVKYWGMGKPDCLEAWNFTRSDNSQVVEEEAAENRVRGKGYVGRNKGEGGILLKIFIEVNLMLRSP